MDQRFASGFFPTPPRDGGGALAKSSHHLPLWVTLTLEPPTNPVRFTLSALSPVATDDLVRRNFTVDRPHAVWLSDFTHIRTWEGWSYLAVVLDVRTRRIVGWQLASHMRQSLVSDALEMAIASRKEREATTIAHSDNGSQYTSYEYTERLKRAGIAPSRGRTGTALDNAMAESIMSTSAEPGAFQAGIGMDYAAKPRTRELPPCLLTVEQQLLSVCFSGNGEHQADSACRIEFSY